MSREGRNVAGRAHVMMSMHHLIGRMLLAGLFTGMLAALALPAPVFAGVNFYVRLTTSDGGPVPATASGCLYRIGESAAEVCSGLEMDGDRPTLFFLNTPLDYYILRIRNVAPYAEVEREVTVDSPELQERVTLEAPVVELPTEAPLPTVAPTDTPVPTAMPTSTPEPTSTPTMVPTETPVPTSTPTNTPEPTATATIAPTSTPTPTIAPTETPEPTTTPLPTETPLPTMTPTSTPEPTPEPTETPAPTAVPTNTPQPTMIPTETPTLVPTQEPTSTPEPTAIPTETPVPTVTPVPTETSIPTSTSVPPTSTPEPTAVSTSTPDPTETPVPTDIPQPTEIVPTETPMPTTTPAATDTPVPTLEPTVTPVPTQSPGEPTPEQTSVPVTTPTPIATNEPTAAAATVTATAISTSEPTSVPPTAVPTQTSGAGDVTLTLQTVDGAEIPSTARVCIGNVCRDMGEGEVRMAIAGPRTLMFGALPSGTHPLLITGAHPYADVIDEVTVEEGRIATVTVVLVHAPLPTTMATTVPVRTEIAVPTTPGDGTGGAAPGGTATNAPAVHTRSGTGGERPAGSGSVAVNALPRTGAGHTSSASITLLLTSGLIVIGAAGLAWRRYSR